MVTFQENEVLQKKIDSLTKDLERFTNGRQNLDALLGNQRMSNNKSGLGYNGFNAEAGSSKESSLKVF